MISDIGMSPIVRKPVAGNWLNYPCRPVVVDSGEAHRGWRAVVTDEVRGHGEALFGLDVASFVLWHRGDGDSKLDDSRVLELNATTPLQ